MKNTENDEQGFETPYQISHAHGAMGVAWFATSQGRLSIRHAVLLRTHTSEAALPYRYNDVPPQ
jgi:hypothetical protein